MSRGNRLLPGLLLGFVGVMLAIGWVLLRPVQVETPGLVVAVFDQSILLTQDDTAGGLISAPMAGVPVLDGEGNTLPLSAVSAGDRVTLATDGAILESWPAQFHQVYRLTLTGERDAALAAEVWQAYQEGLS